MIRIALMLIASAIIAACAQLSPGGMSEAELTRQSMAAVPRGPWPAGDEVGMANAIGPGTWSRCAYYLSRPGARSYELSYERSTTMPMSPFGGALSVSFKPTASSPGTRHVANGEVVSGEIGAQGTQMDALGHIGYYEEPWDPQGEPPLSKARYYGGYTQGEVKPTPDSPLQRLGIENAPPLITSAVLLDAKQYIGKGEAMSPGQMITAADVEAMLAAQKLTSRGILPGDVVYIRTGWGEHWRDPDREHVYYTMGPGLAYDAARYFEAHGVVLVALDNPFTDPVADGQLKGRAKPPQGTDQGLPFIVHQQDLAVAGIHQIQNAKLDELARDRVWTSCTMVLPLRDRGHAGSPVRPVAIGVPRP